MREIKFRAWNKEKKVLAYDNEDDSRDYWDGAVASNVGMINSILKDDDYIFMQSTGLLDKNGKEIYDGDILKVKDLGFSYEYIGVINFDEDTFAYLIGIQKEYPTMRCGKQYLFLLQRHHSFEIIGNIYENPELLDN